MCPDPANLVLKDVVWNQVNITQTIGDTPVTDDLKSAFIKLIGYSLNQDETTEITFDFPEDVNVEFITDVVVRNPAPYENIYTDIYSYFVTKTVRYSPDDPISAGEEVSVSQMSGFELHNHIHALIIQGQVVQN